MGFSPQPQIFGVKAPDVWSPDNRHILFSDDRTGKWMLNVMNVDGSGVMQLMQGNDPPMEDALWSPSGKQVAYALNPGNGRMQIAAINIDGTNRRVIATGDPAKSNVVWLSNDLIAWSQDERFIYYEYETGDGHWYIVKTAADGANNSQIIASGYAPVQGIYINGWLGNDSVLYYVTQSQGTSDVVTWRQTNNGKTLPNEAILQPVPLKSAATKDHRPVQPIMCCNILLGMTFPVPLGRSTGPAGAISFPSSTTPTTRPRSSTQNTLGTA